MNKQVVLVFSAIILFSGFLLRASAVEAAPVPQWQEITMQQDVVVLVEKAANAMTVFYQGNPVKRFLCVSGVNTQGDKQRQGDNRTPEGTFFITDKELLQDDPYLGRKWIGLSYPDPVHAQKGMEQNLISVSQYQEIILANEQKVQPPQDTALGGWIGIHGDEMI
ncbi:L,D-transpeptidase catalytic domain [Pelosinus fermentans]|uniref:L,D-transpeptidase n=1 Tax=Pelosinus fermentans TaxID=365349 RepID=UPI0007D7E41D|nr:L,D-transpeptidase [Pelosinus fermentans]OAM95298.1 ErfK/YbiS/YcfS/YnhG family protein [Pelosinus fermentans DSM 17108]SDR26096.1 L,D-transpeptidase catalytic domain [Pelosinus fermentans]